MKNFICIILLILTNANVFCQNNFLIFPKVSYTFNSIKYESNWKDLTTFTKQYTYGFGINVGKIFLNSEDIKVSVDIGIEYSHFLLSANIDTSKTINNNKVFNKSYDENFNFISIPLRGIIYFPVISSYIVPGIEISLINNFPSLLNSSGSAQLLNGSIKEYNISVNDYFFSFSIGLLLKIPINKFSIVIYGAYESSLQYLYKNKSANLTINGFNISLLGTFNL